MTTPMPNPAPYPMPAYEQLEIALADWADVEPWQMVVCSSGTAALHLALEALRLPKGAKILIPDFTMVACARAAHLTGLTPVFVDCHDDDLLIDPDLIDLACATEEDITAVMPVHIYGRQCDMGGISDLATKYDLYVIEDLAEAHGVYPHPNSDAACWSFYQNKILAGEEGGAVWFYDDDRADLARQLRSLGFTFEHDFTHVPGGHNYRLANVLASLIQPNLDRFEEICLLRDQIEEMYDDRCVDEWRMPARDMPWVYDLRIPGLDYATQDYLVRTLRQNGIQARHGFKPISRMDEFIDCKRYTLVTHGETRAESASREVIYLPIQHGITTLDMVYRSFEIIKEVLLERKSGLAS